MPSVFLRHFGSARARPRLQPAVAPNDTPSALEKLQAEALKNNHDIKVGEAKVRLAQAELERTRANVKERIAVAHAKLKAAQAGLAEGKERYERALRFFKRDEFSREDFQSAKLTMEKLQKGAAVAAARMERLLGRPLVEKPTPEKQPGDKKKP